MPATRCRTTTAQLNLDVESADLNNITDFGANYVNSFGAFDIAVSGRYGVAFLASDFNNDDSVGDTFDNFTRRTTTRRSGRPV